MGFGQVPGVDFFDSHYPVMSEICFRMLLILKLQKEWHMIAVDIEKAFLESALNEEIYMRIPEGLK